MLLRLADCQCRDSMSLLDRIGMDGHTIHLHSWDVIQIQIQGSIHTIRYNTFQLFQSNHFVGPPFS